MDLGLLVISFMLLLIIILSLVISYIMSEIMTIRKRLHKLEGREVSLSAHLDVFNKWLGGSRDICKRLDALEHERKTQST